MQFQLKLNQSKSYGQIPVTDRKGQIHYLIRGNLDNPNHTLYLKNIQNQEIGRLFNDRNGLVASYIIDVFNHSLVSVKKINSPAVNLFFVTRLNYWIAGSIKKGSYKFRSIFKEVAAVKTIVSDDGLALICEITRPEDVPFILLIAVLFTQWHVTPLRLPSFPLFGKKFSTSYNC